MKPQFRSLSLASALLGFSTGTLSWSQSVVWTVDGPPLSPPFPLSTAGYPSRIDAGEDVNGDGVPDVIAAAPAMFTSSVWQYQGEVYVYSGSDGSLIHKVKGPFPNDYLGLAVSLTGDLNGDGQSEFAASRAADSIKVFSGANPAIQWEIQPPAPWSCDCWWVLDELQYDADGIPDLVLGCPSADPPTGGSNAGAVAVVSGVDGAPLAVWGGPAAYDRFGHSVAEAGDLDADGVPDLLVGAPGYTDIGTSQELGDSYATLRSGASGAEIHHFLPEKPLSWYNPRFGWSVDGDLDLDGFGTPDLLVGESMALGAGVFAGETGTILYDTHVGSSYAVQHIGDVDGDGFSDYLIGDPQDGIPACWDPRASLGCGAGYVRSGADGSVIYVLKQEASSGFGNVAAAAGDVDGDDVPDVVLGDAYWGPDAYTDQGRLTMYSLIPQGVQTLGLGCSGYGGEVPRIGVRGSPVLGTTIQVHLSKAEPGVPAVLALGFSDTTWLGLSLPLGLAALGMPGCSLFISPNVVIPVVTQLLPPAPGRATVAIPVPGNPSFVGFTAFAQWWVGSSTASPDSVTRALRFDLF